MEFVRGVPWNFAAYSPRFCSMLPLLDETADGGSELEGKWAGNDGYQGNGCLEIRGYLGGKKKRQAITLFRLDDAMTMEPLVVSVVMKKEAEKWVRTGDVTRRTEWNLLLDFAVENVEKLKEEEENEAAEEGNEAEKRKEEKEPEMIIHRRLVETATSAGAGMATQFIFVIIFSRSDFSVSPYSVWRRLGAMVVDDSPDSREFRGSLSALDSIRVSQRFVRRESV